MLLPFVTRGQDARSIERPKDVKVIREFIDKHGNTVRELQYKQGRMIISETIFLPKPKIVIRKEEIKDFKPEAVVKDSVLVLIDKSHYTLTVLYNKKPVRIYRAVFGPNPALNKQMQGDRNTPEGWFRITRLNPNSKYNKYMEISYPNDKYRKRFQKLKADGVIPRSANIGGNIGIHGIWKGGDDMIELGVGWTDGCIALRNSDMDDLYKLIGIGTKVFISK